MTLKSIFSLLIIALLLAACAGPTSIPLVVVTENATVPPSPTSDAPATYPVTAQRTPVATTSFYPAPAIPTPIPPSIPTSGYEPQPGDDKLKRDEVFLDLASSQLEVTATNPIQAQVILTGNLPEQHQLLRVAVTPPDAKNTIVIEVYSLVPPGVVSIPVLKPFTATIPLGIFSTGQYTVMVNGEKLGEFGTAYAPQPEDNRLTRGDVTLDMGSSELLTTTQPMQVSAILQGTLPDPCHKLRIVYTPPDAQNKIYLVVYSVFDPQMMCIMVIQPFQVIYPFGNFPSGHYSVYVNGQLLGEFDA